VKIAAQIREKIKSINESEPFGYADLGLERSHFVTAAKALERMQKKGEIKKVSKGVFYKPKMTFMGALGPDYNKILNNFLYKNGKRIGYITGGELYNSLNLTTQNYFRYKIATNSSRKKFEMNWLKASTVKSYVEVTEDNYQLLGILDAIKDIKQIADTPTLQVLKMLTAKIGAFKKVDIKQLLQLSLAYPPRVRALLGAIIESKFGDTFNLKALQRSINPTTSFKLGIKSNELPTMINWKIK
jgi:Family of unknown function (DUF6088)